MRIDVIESNELLLELKTNWDAVYERDPEANYFLSWPWLSRWLEDDRHQWFILAAAPEGEKSYVAFFPLRLRTKMRKRGGGFYNELTLAGRSLADYAGLIADPVFEEEAIGALGRYLAASRWAVLNFECMRISQHRLSLLLRHLPEARFGISETDHINKRDNVNNNICPRIELPPSWEDYLASVGQNTRQKMRRFLRKVDEGGACRITFADETTIARDLDILLNFWSIKWTPRKGDRVPGLVRANRAMFEVCFADGALMVPVFWQDDRPVGALATFIDRQHRSLLFYMAGRDETFHGPVAPGFVLHAFCIRDAIAKGFHSYDFLRGNEEYKYQFGAKDVKIRSLLISAPKGENLNGKLDPRCILKVLKKTLLLHKGGRNAEAALGYRQVLDVTPNSPTALHGYGQLLASQGDHKAAARCFRKLVTVKPDARKAWLRLGNSLEASKRYGDAAKAYRELIRQSPSDSIAYMQLARALGAMGRKDEAGSAYATAAGLQRPTGAGLN